MGGKRIFFPPAESGAGEGRQGGVRGCIIYILFGGGGGGVNYYPPQGAGIGRAPG